MKKIKVLAYCDSPTAKTGFGNVIKENFTRMADEFDFRIIGINYFGDRHQLPFFIHQMPDIKNDPYGLGSFERLLLAGEKPDVILLFQDMFILGGKAVAGGRSLISIAKDVYPDVPVVSYFPVDGEPVFKEYVDEILKSDVSLTLSRYGVDAIKKCCSDASVDYIYHGVDSDVFHVMDEKDRLAVKSRLSGSAGDFLVVMVNRFQPRKNVDSALKALSLFKHGYKVCSKCGNYYPIDSDICDLNNCDSGYVHIERARKNVSLYLHMENYEPIAMGKLPTDTLANHVKNAGFTSDDHVGIPRQGGTSVSVESLNSIYNAADVFVSTTLGEGFGLTAIEASAAGTQVIIADNTTAREVVPTAMFVKNAAHFVLPSDSSIYRRIVSVPDLVKKIESCYRSWAKNGNSKVIDNAGVVAVGSMTWDDSATKLSSALKLAIRSVKDVKKSVKIYTL